MRKIRLILAFLCFSMLSLVSFRCTMNRWLFLIEIIPKNTEGITIDNLELKLSSKSIKPNDNISFYPTYRYIDGVKMIDSYCATLYNCPISDVPLESRYLDWDKLQPILDNYAIEIYDAKGIYKDYKISSIRSLIENSEYKNRKLSIYDDEGNVLPEALTFTIQLEKQDIQQ